jgi:hypothetical protein
MTSSSSTSPTSAGTSGAPTPSILWRRWGGTAGYVAGSLFLLQTVLFLLDATGVLAPQVGFVDTPAGVMEDLATYFVATNERMHTIWWDVAVRDVAGPVGFLALMVLVIAVVRVAGTRQPRQEIGALVVVLGGSLGALNDLMYLSYIHWWRHGGFRPSSDIVSFGVTLDAIDNVGTFLQRAGFSLIALGFVLLAPTLGRLRPDRRWLSHLARLEAAALVAWLGTDVADTRTAHYVAAVAAGLVLGPALAVLAGHALATRGPRAARGHGSASPAMKA